jgi:histidinol dehydrogenase
MQIVRFPSKEEWKSLSERPSIDNRLLIKQVGKILADVKKGGDRALKKYTKKFDAEGLKKLVVSPKEIKAAAEQVSDALKLAISQAIGNITKFHEEQKATTQVVETMPGVHCWRKSIPINRVGIYIPGGTAPLFSTVLMLGIPAKIAGCPEVVLFTPPSKDGSVHPAILYAAQQVGITEIYRCGGAQGIAAMAFGTQTINKVDKIFGPGNQYVTAAKQLVQLEGVAIDMPAGPSEVCVLADNTSNPAFVAADLLSQAEHGPDSQVILVSTDSSVVERCLAEVARQLPLLKRAATASQALENSKAVVLRDMSEAMDFVNQYAAEHLILASEDALALSERVTQAGSVFIGNYSPESAGDYASGTNHTLPTNGFANAYSGVSVDSFVKKVTFQYLTKEGIGLLGNTIIEMAEAEGLDAHANAVRVRLNKSIN